MAFASEPTARPASEHITLANGLLRIRHSDTYETLVGRYFSKLSYLRGACFNSDVCRTVTECRIIGDAVSLSPS